MKLTFDFYSDNRKKAEARKIGGGPVPPPLTDAEEIATDELYQVLEEYQNLTRKITCICKTTK